MAALALALALAVAGIPAITDVAKTTIVGNVGIALPSPMPQVLGKGD